MARARTTGIRLWDQVTLRLPPGMRDQINEIAAQNGRSANAEIVARLQASMVSADTTSLEAVRHVVREEVRAALAEVARKK
ncbi:Arc family DNA-binding protein [Bordetella bronchialis]|uniref:Arc family DNA-binding protein n=1 Tax=Bordetella bronchialis TaxID=463025 RepID=UPI003D09320F